MFGEMVTTTYTCGELGEYGMLALGGWNHDTCEVPTMQVHSEIPYGIGNLDGLQMQSEYGNTIFFFFFKWALPCKASTSRTMG